MSTKLNLVVIRSTNIEAAACFYGQLGLQFSRHAHGSGPEHFAAEESEIVFEIYPHEEGTPPTAATRIGFKVDDIDSTLNRLASAGGRVLSLPKESPWGRRAVILDLDGHRVELTSASPT